MPADLLDPLRDALPPYAAPLRQDLDAVVATPGHHLTALQHWGTVLAAAATVRAGTTTPALAAEARQHLSPEAVDAALGVAAVMATSAVYFRARHFLHGGYDDLRAGLRTRVTSSPGAGRADVELWAVAVSAVVGCESCVTSHEASARAAGLSREAVNDALRIAAVVHAVASVLEAARLV
ncbi:MAG TPA: carboxymuconolactone decarboxylase family protein [Candidatus Angelobacter sp.]|nr:carboxymuconolactone decarboxylase family protein [Candidatus Angelobacter sp.]